MNRPIPLFPSAILGAALTCHVDLVPAENFVIAEDLEISVWASSPMFYNRSNMDIDQSRRIWVAEAANYRKFKNTAPIA